MSTIKPKSDQYQLRLSQDFRNQLEYEMKNDGDSSLAAWIKRVLRKELQSRGVEPKA